MKKSFEPLIKRESTLQEKNVMISGVHDFDRDTNFSPQIEVKKDSDNETNKVKGQKQEKTVPEEFFKAIKTAKISPDVLLRLNTLKPFIEELEEIDKSTVNEMLQLLIESYVNTRLTNRQREGYNQMYQHVLEFNKK
ncbi:hypothetical protein [Enterococcus lactis]|uniref:hypothetical protein n=1 Tax=Enterococcus lactis TaxID=357441 RepID=UPI001BCDD379|nr:hypothetical protein [Enterococcus lactis]